MAWSDKESDREIWRLLSGDPELAFSRVLQLHGSRILGYLRGRFPSLDEAQRQDILTDALLALAQTFDPRRGPLAAWLLLLAHQQAARLLRASPTPWQLADAVWDDQAGDDDEPLDVLISLERLEQLQAEIQRLPGLERAVIAADLEQGQTVQAEELAVQLDTTVASVYAARSRGRAKLMQRCDWVRQWLQRGSDIDERTT